MESRTLFKDHGRWKLEISPKERARLVAFQQRHRTAYLRERASAMRQVAEGRSPHWVALHGLLQPRDPDIVYTWLQRYARLGLAGLFQTPRIRAERVSPSDRWAVYSAIHEKTPEDYGLQAGRWTLGLLHQVFGCLKTTYRSLSGVWYFLQRLQLRVKRGRPDNGHSPDLEFQRKIRRIRSVLGYCRRHPQRAVLLSVDEFSFYRQPVVSRAWWRRGRRHQPPAKRAQKSNTRGRIVGAVNCVTGAVTFTIASKITVSAFCTFLRKLRVQYPAPVKLYLILDNWPSVHRHDRVRALMDELAILPAWTPTYTPEANPIERLWWQLAEGILAHHRYSDDWTALKARISGWVELFATPSDTILQLVGLLHGKALPISGV